MSIPPLTVCGIICNKKPTKGSSFCDERRREDDGGLGSRRRHVMARDDPVESGRIMSSLLAQSQHRDRADACLLSG